jgi:hypothetical protein
MAKKWLRRNLALIITLLVFYFLLIPGFVFPYIFPYRPPLQIFLPSINITAPTTELIVAIAEVVVGVGIMGTLLVEALPFLSRKGADITKR